MTRNRRLAAGVVFVYLTLSLAETEALSESVGDIEGPPPPRNAPHVHGVDSSKVTYDKIEGLILKGPHATVVTDKTQFNCEMMCSQSSSCKSYSYNAEKKLCVASQDALSYDQDFVFYAKKEGHMDANTPGAAGYHEPFPGLTYKPSGWTKLSGKTLADCMALCSKATSCKTFSYRAKDRACLVSEHGIQYSRDFTYYEKNRATAPLPPAAKQVTKQLGERNENKSADVVRSPALIAMEVKTKAKVQEAVAAHQRRNKTLISNEARIADLKKVVATTVKRAMDTDKVKLDELKAAFTKKANENFEKTKNDMKLDFAKKELTEKATLDKESIAAAKEKDQKATEEVKEKGRQQVASTLRQAQAAESTEAEKLKVAAELKATQEKEARALATKAKAEEISAADKVKLEAEKQKMKLALDHQAKEAKTKDDASKAERLLLEIRTEKRTKYTKVATNEKTHKLNMKEKAQEAMLFTQAATNRVRKAEAFERVAKSNVAKANEMQLKNEAAAAAAKTKEDTLARQRLAALSQKNANADAAKLQTDRLVEESTNAVVANQIKQTMTEIDSKEKRNKEMERVQDMLTKRQRKAVFQNNRYIERTHKAQRAAEVAKRKPTVDNLNKAYKMLHEKLLTLSRVWDKDKDSLRAERATMLHSLRQQLDTVRASVNKDRHVARSLAKETMEKAVAKKEAVIAAATAKARWISARSAETAGKIPGQRTAVEKASAGLKKFDLVCDVAAYVDTGLNRDGAVEWPLENQKLVDLKIQMVKAKVASDDAEQKYNIIKRKQTPLMKDTTANFEKEMNRTARVFAENKKKTMAIMQDTARQLRELPSSGQMTQQQSALQNGGYGPALNITPLMSISPTPAPTSQGGTSPTASPTAPPTAPIAPLGATSMASRFDVTALMQSEETEIERTGRGFQNIRANSCQFSGGSSRDGSNCHRAINSNTGDALHINGRTGLLAMDLGVLRAVKAVRLFKNEGSSGIKTFTVQISQDNSQWTDVRQFTAERRQNGWNTFTLPRITTTRYIALSVQGNYGAGHTLVRALEFHVENTAAPSRAPTRAPTYNIMRVKELQKEADTLVAKSKKVSVLVTVNTKAAKDAAGFDNDFKKRKAKLTSNFERRMEAMNRTIWFARMNANDTKRDLEKVQQQYDKQILTINALKSKPANTAFGKLPEQASKQGFLHLQKSNTQQQAIFLQFPSGGRWSKDGTRLLGPNDTIAEAHLKLFKYGGGGGPVRVEIASCQWTRATITYSNSVFFGYGRVSQGTTVELPSDQNVWATIALKADAVQNARLAGSHICLRVSGGPAAAPAVFSSELSSQAPILEVFAKVGPKAEIFEPAPVKKITPPNPAEEKLKICKAKLAREILKQKTKKLLKENKKKAIDKIAKLKKVTPRDLNAEDVMAVMNMQIEGAEEAAAMIKGQAKALNKRVKMVVSKQLTALANKNATKEEIALAVGQLRRKAAGEVGVVAAKDAQKIQKTVNAGLADDEEKLQKKNEKDKDEYYKKKMEIQAEGRKLSEEQKAALKVEVEEEVARKAQSVCKMVTPAETTLM